MNGVTTVMLNEEYERTLTEVSKATTASDEAKWQLQKLSELHKQMLAEEKAAEDFAFQDREIRLKETQASEGKKDRIIKIVLEGAAILVPVTVSSYWMAKGLKFEQDGTFTSRTGQWLGNHLRLFKK